MSTTNQRRASAPPRLGTYPDPRQSTEEGPLGDCSICLDVIEPDSTSCTTACRHNFHLQCIQEWRSRKGNICPNCRASIVHSRTQDVENTTEQAGATSTEHVSATNIERLRRRVTRSRLIQMPLFLGIRLRQDWRNHVQSLSYLRAIATATEYIRISGAVIEKDNVYVRGDHNTVKGSRNIVIGKGNRIVGDFVKVVGEACYVLANDSDVRYDNNDIEGDRNRVNGCRNEVRGRLNRITGDFNLIVSRDSQSLGYNTIEDPVG